MQYNAGIDVSLEQSSVCVVDAAGKIVKEAKGSDPHVLVTFFKGLGFPVTRIGTVDQELPLLNEYLAAENRILKAQ